MNRITDMAEPIDPVKFREACLVLQEAIDEGCREDPEFVASLGFIAKVLFSIWPQEVTETNCRRYSAAFLRFAALADVLERPGFDDVVRETADSRFQEVQAAVYETAAICPVNGFGLFDVHEFRKLLSGRVTELETVAALLN